MDKNLISTAKKQLLEEKERLERELGNIAKKRGEKFNPVYPEYGSKDEENAAEVTAYILNLALDKNLEKMLSEVLAALHRIESGVYGKCTSCSKDINPERLSAFPSAPLCITCQSKKENPVKKFFLRFKSNKK